MSPTCCDSSQESRIVRFFVPAAQSSPAHWTVPTRIPNEDTVNETFSMSCAFCPFCGTKLTLAHIPFEEQRPSQPSSPSHAERPSEKK